MQYMKNYIAPIEVIRLYADSQDLCCPQRLRRAMRRINCPRTNLMFLELAGPGDIHVFTLDYGMHDLNKHFSLLQHGKAAYVLPTVDSLLHLDKGAPFRASVGDALLMDDTDVVKSWLHVDEGNVLVLIRVSRYHGCPEELHGGPRGRVAGA